MAADSRHLMIYSFSLQVTVMREKDPVLFQIPLSESVDGPLAFFLKADIPKGVAASIARSLVEQNKCDVLATWISIASSYKTEKKVYVEISDLLS